MGKTKRDIETNKQISIICIVMLSIIIATFMFVSIILYFNKIESTKKIDSLQTQINALNYENSSIEEEINSYSELISSATDPKTYIRNFRNEYELELPLIEKHVKSSEAEYKIAYLNFIITEDTNLKDILTILSNNNILANFYSDNKELYDSIKNDGHELGLYVNNNDNIETFYDDNKPIIDSYDMSLFMANDALGDISISNMKQVKENSTSEDKKQLTKNAYVDSIIETTADRAFLIIKINGDNSLGVSALESIISGLKEKGYIFLPLISKSSIFD